MSFYRTIIAAVAAMGLGFATSAFAADDVNAQTAAPTDTKAMQTADATSTTGAAATTGTTTDQTTQNNMQSNTTDSKVNINTANAKDLMKVKGLSAAKAKAIVTYRKKHGDFKSLDDLKDVKGFKKMSDKSMKKIQDQLTIG